MRASFPRKVWIMATTIYLTIYMSILAIWRIRIRKNYTNEYGEKVFTWYGKTIIDNAKANLTINWPDGFEFEPGKRYIIMSNHRSLYDVPICAYAFNGAIRMISKKEFFRFPIWGNALKTTDFVSIDRSNLERAKKDLEHAKKVLEKGIILWIAAEGTRSDDARLLPFKKGGFILAIETGATILPIGIDGSEKILPPRTWDFSLYQDVTLNIGDPIDASEYTVESRDELIDRTWHVIARLAGEE